MKGLLFITIDTEVRPPWFSHGDKPYFGFNGGYGVELWKGLEEWNDKNPDYKLLKGEHEDFVSLSQVENVKSYADYVTGKYGHDFYLIIVSDETNEKQSFDDFSFIGYDFGYIYGDNHTDWYVLFSCIANELLKKSEFINAHLRSLAVKINQYGLFQSFGDALVFKNKRDLAKAKNEIDGIEVNFSEFDFLQIWLYNKTNPFIKT